MASRLLPLLLLVALSAPSQAGSINGSNGSLRFGLTPNNAFHAPSIKYVDLRISRRFKVTEGSKIELLAEGFNIFNRTQVTGVNNRMYVLSAFGHERDWYFRSNVRYTE